MADGDSPGTPVKPAVEVRGGEHPDWAGAEPGQPVRELPDPVPGEPAADGESG